MAKPNTKSLDWLDDMAALAAEKAKNPSANYDDLAETLKTTKSKVSYLFALKATFDPESVEKVRQAAQGNRPFILSYKSALALTGLVGRVPNLPQAVQEALEVVLTQRYATRHIEALVEHLAEGNPAKEFDHKKVKNRKREAKKAPSTPLTPPRRLTMDAGHPAQAPETTPATAKTIGQHLDDALDGFSKWWSGLDSPKDSENPPNESQSEASDKPQPNRAAQVVFFLFLAWFVYSIWQAKGDPSLFTLPTFHLPSATNTPTVTNTQIH